MLERPTRSRRTSAPNLEMIRQNVNLQSRLIDDLLDVMRIVRGKMPLHWEVVNSHFLIQNSVQICQSEVYGKELQIVTELDLAADRHHINADPVRLQQVLWNLIKNAVKFTPGKEARSRSEAGTRPTTEGASDESDLVDRGLRHRDRDRVPECVDLIFDPFQQGRDLHHPDDSAAWGWAWPSARGSSKGHGGRTDGSRAPARIEGRLSGLRVSERFPTLPARGSRTDDPTPSQITRLGDPSKATLKILLVEDEQATSRYSWPDC